MVIGTTVFILVILIVTIWVIIEVKRFKHKLLAIFLIGLVLFSYFSFSVVIKQHKDINFSTPSGMLRASELYFSWLGSLFGNIKQVTTNAIHMNWSGETTNSTH